MKLYAKILTLVFPERYILKKCRFIVWLYCVFCSGAPNENIVQNHLNIELLNVF